MKLSDGLKTVFLAGVGAIAVTGEKSKKVIDDLVKKGELTVEEGKILNEDLTKNFGEKLNERTKQVADRAGNLTRENIRTQIREMLVDLDKMTQDERDALRRKLDAADKAAKEAFAELKEEAEEIIDAITAEAVEDQTVEAEQEDALEDAEEAVAESAAACDEEAAESAQEIVEALTEDAVEDNTVEAEQEDVISDAFEAVAEAEE